MRLLHDISSITSLHCPGEIRNLEETENHHVPAYEDQGMLPQPLAVQYSFHQYNAAEPECCCSPLERLAMGVAAQLFCGIDP